MHASKTLVAESTFLLKIFSLISDALLVAVIGGFCIIELFVC